MSFDLDLLNDHDIDELLSQKVEAKTSISRDNFLRLIKEKLACVQKINHKVIIAGTNGKGETAQTLNQLLIERQHNTLLWTSPHIFSFRERFIFNGRPIKKELFISLIEQVFNWKQKHNIALSMYDFLFLVLIEWIAYLEIDVLILEVGLGGRLDACNFVDCDIAALTSISRDHQELLGNSYKSILLEKLPVCRPNKVLFYNLELDYCKQITSKYCEKYSINGFDILKKEAIFHEKNYSLKNKALAVSVANYILKTNLNFTDIISTTSFARNISLSVKNRDVFLSGAHNPDGMRHLVQTLSNVERFIVAFSKRPLDDMLTMIKAISYKFPNAQLFMTTLNEPKIYTELAQLETLCHNNQIQIQKMHSWQDEWEHGVGSGQKVVFTGSYYFIARVWRFFLNA